MKETEALLKLPELKKRKKKEGLSYSNSEVAQMTRGNFQLLSGRFQVNRNSLTHALGSQELELELRGPNTGRVFYPNPVRL